MGDGMDPAILPEEIWIKILIYCDINDILSCGYTCKYLNKTVSSDFLWKKKWMQLESVCMFKFPSVCRAQMNHKEMCMRLYTILHSNTVFSRCHKCMEFSCQPFCVEDSNSKVVVDIGNKFTWVITPVFYIHRHYTLFGIPKMPANNGVDCTSDTMSIRSRPQEDTGNPGVTVSSALPTRRAMEYEHGLSGPFCMLCSPVKQHCKKPVAHQNGMVCCPSQHAELLNGFCTDTLDTLGIPNIDMVSPAAALLQDKQFPVVREFLAHLFHHMGLVPVLQKPNSVVVFCEPLTMSNTIRIHLLHYLFLRMKVTRVCMIAKPLAISAKVGMDTCVVVDSGALSTSVAVVVNGQLVPERWKLIPVGGWHVSEYLKEAMQWQPEEYTEILVSHLDSLAVKVKCRLSYNFANEERHRRPAHRRHINLPVDCCAGNKQLLSVSLGPELYLAPEMMYTSLGLPQAILDVISGLPVNTLKECLCHILLTGGNSELTGFKARLHRDLCDLLPEYSKVLDLWMQLAPNSCNVAVGSLYVTLPSTECA